MSLFHATILTIFPEIFPGSLSFSLAGTALKKNIWSYDVINIRDFGITKHRNVDDTPYGGGDGLVMRSDVLGRALDHALLHNPGSTIYYPSPRGKRLDQGLVKQIITQQNIIILCGRFEGIDERIIDEYNVEEISLGDYILSGGEIAAMAILDCSIRLLPGVLINRKSLMAESFEREGDWQGLLEGPLYTKPAIWRGRKVPEILLSGHHSKMKEWQKSRALETTKVRRPDLLNNYIRNIK